MDHQFENDQEADPITILRGGTPFPTPVVETVAKLRALSILLCLDVELAEELVAVTLTRASVAFDPSRFDTNLTSWLYRRLRSYYYRDYFRLIAEREMVAAPAFADEEQSDAFGAIAELPVEQREALVLVEAAGFSPNEGAAICRCTRNRFKELLRRARTGLARTLPGQRSGAFKVSPVADLFETAQATA